MYVSYFKDRNTQGTYLESLYIPMFCMDVSEHYQSVNKRRQLYNGLHSASAVHRHARKSGDEE